MFRFESPWMFLLLLLIPLAFYLHRRGSRRPAIRYSSATHAQGLGSSIRRTLIAVPFVVRVAALVLIVVALARPQMGTERVLDTSHGVAIEMVIDRSSSMSAELRYRGRKVNRLDIALRLFREFVVGGAEELKGRQSDLIGVITFARYPDTICPLTIDHDSITGFLPTIKLAERESEDGTAIGDALALAAARLQTAEETLARQTGAQKEYDIKSKVIILLTDGENNAGERTVEEAAELAAAWGIKVYAIGIGGGSQSTIGRWLGMPMGPGVNEEALQNLAKTTGGVYRLAEDADALRGVYKEIDRLETSEIESFRFTEYRELFSNFALAALALLGLEVLLAATIFRRIP
ncbi:MAG: VWA domain-containing protein [bacterium]|nr:VWA domain-containing protein [bacterium]